MITQEQKARTYYLTDAQFQEIIGHLFERPKTYNLIRLLEAQFTNNMAEENKPKESEKPKKPKDKK